MKSDMEEKNQDSELGSKALSQFMDIFVTPEVQRRQNAGELPKPLNLRAAQIIFYPDDRKPQIRINSEVKAISKMNLKSGVLKKLGEPVYEHEIKGLEKINITEEDNQDCGHATFIRIGNSWTIAFDFRYNKALSKKHIGTAQQFFESAESSFEKKNWSPFIDNLFSASELLAKAMLLSTPIRELNSHRAIRTQFNQSVKLGNIEVEYKRIFKKLSCLRYSARYLKGKLSMSEEKARTFLDIIKNKIEYAKLRIMS